MRFHIVDTFTDERFAGTPAAVVPASVFPPVDLMQGMASCVDLPTTAFVVPAGPGEYRVRCFTPREEIDLCAHATIASARHLFGQPADADRSRLTFVSDSGIRYAERIGDLIAIDDDRVRIFGTAVPRDPLRLPALEHLGAR
jgi:PhzF family phenazine biosynthesis protein